LAFFAKHGDAAIPPRKLCCNVARFVIDENS
jgi:hypothetical protein